VFRQRRRRYSELKQELWALLKCLEKHTGIVYVRLDNTNGPESLRITPETLLEARREK
jgi:hypothetical protein